MNRDLWHGRRVFVTGHTGFMGGWLAERLVGLGADVTGYALAPPTDPCLFETIGLESRVNHVTGDVRDAEALANVLRGARAEIVFHLAAQPLVRRAHRDPLETFSTNVMGTVNLLDAVRRSGTVAAVVVVTTDKVYENREWPWGYRESDALGGHEPYGVSKACAELAVEAYVRSYFGASGPGVATVRAGNIIGGGDWAEDRLVPDAIRAFSGRMPLTVRHPEAVRPWQHVLEPVSGMLMLAGGLAEGRRDLAGAWNFGPGEDDAKPVAWLADRLTSTWGTGASWRIEPDAGPYEANLLTLASAKARTGLGWTCRWDAGAAVTRATEWYRSFYQGADMADLTRQQINDYVEGDSRGKFQRKADQKHKRAVA